MYARKKKYVKRDIATINTLQTRAFVINSKLVSYRLYRLLYYE